jgi:hypothetical protein
MPTQAALESRVWFEAMDSNTNHRFSIAKVDAALIEEAKDLAYLPIGREYLAPWTEKSTTTIDTNSMIPACAGWTPAATQPTRILYLVIYCREIRFIQGPDDDNFPGDTSISTPRLFVKDGNTYIEPVDLYKAIPAAVYYIPAMTSALVQLVHPSLENALVYGAASKLLAHSEPEAAKLLKERRDAAIPGAQ